MAVCIAQHEDSVNMELDRLIVLLPWAFSAGALATFNPCGVAMLPAYLSYYVTGTTEQASVNRNVLTGAGVGVAMTAGVLLVFLLAGSVVSAAGAGVARVLPVVNLAIGAVIVGLGGALLVRPAFALEGPFSNPLAARPALAEGRSVRTFAVFGAGYGVASLGCTLPIFLVVMAQALTAGGFLSGVAVFLTYGLGMGTVLMALSVAVGTGRGVLVSSLRRVVPYVRRLGALGMIAAGGYLMYYQMTVGRLLILGR